MRVVDNWPVSGQFDGSHGWHGTSKHGTRGCGLVDPVNQRLLIWTVEFSHNAL